jgi:hypothetical protein
MQILPDYNFPYSIDDVTGVMIPKFAWYYDAIVNDFMLKTITMLEETTGATVVVKINNTQFNVPASWHILVVDDETKMVDTVPIAQCSSSAYQAYLMHPELNRYELSPIQLLDLLPSDECVHLTIPRQCLILHPTSTTVNNKDKVMSCLIGPHDVGKYMGDCSAMELLI